MTAHVVKLTAEIYPITTASWTMSLDGGSAQGPGNKQPYPVIHAKKTDTITFTVAPNPHGVSFPKNAFCAVPGSSKPPPNPVCSPVSVFPQSGNAHILNVTDNGSGPGPATYYYTIKFDNDASGHSVGPVDPIIIHETQLLPGRTSTWSAATIVEVAVVAVLFVLLALFAWRRLRT